MELKLMKCECGCGKTTNIYRGKPRRFIQGHSILRPSPRYKGIDKWVQEQQGLHLCSCGCNKHIQIRNYHFNRGIPKYIHGHYIRIPERVEQTRKMNSKRIGELSPLYKKDRSKIRGRIRCKVDFTKRQKRDIYLRDKGICQRCKMICLVDVDNDHPWKVNIDHIVSVEQGGINKVHNGQVLCLSCHKYKHSAVAKRLNSGKPKRKVVGNPEPSSQSEKVQRLLEHSDMLNHQISDRLEREEIVRL